MLQIKSKVMKNRMQWCKHFALAACLGGHLRSKSKTLGPFFFIVTQLLLEKELNKLLCFHSNPIVVFLYVLYM